MMVLTAAKAGRGSKKVHVLVELLKLQTRTRLSLSKRGRNATTGPAAGTGVGVGVGVGVGANRGSVTVKELMAVIPPAVAWSTWLPVGKAGTRISLVKAPSTSVLRPVDGSTWRLPIDMDETGAKAGKLLAVTVTLEPEGLWSGAAVMDAAGTEWLAVDVAGRPMTVAVTVLVDGIDAPIGTEKVVTKAPELSGLTLTSWVPA